MRKNLNFKLIFENNGRPWKSAGTFGALAEVERAMLFFEREAMELGCTQKAPDQPASKNVETLIFASRALSLAPTTAAKFFEFLNSWSMRPDNRQIRVKIQTGRNKFIEFEGSETLSKQKIEELVAAVEKTLI